MARRNDDDPKSRRNKRNTDIAQDQEQEEQGPEREAPQPEHARMQDQLGNSMIASMMDAGMLGGGMDIEVEYQQPGKQTEQSGPEFGGDDDVVDVQGPLVVEDLASAMNPGIKKGEDTLAFTEPMPDDVLPPEDPDYIDRVAATPSQPLPPTAAWDPLVQPSTDAVRLGLFDWAIACTQWAPQSLHWQLLMAGLERGMPLLQDPAGRVSVARSRTAAIATCGLVAGPALRAHGSAANAAAIDMTTELLARAHRVRTVHATSQRDDAGKLPNARDVFRLHAPKQGGEVRPRQPDEGTARAWQAALEHLAGFTDPMMLLPVASAETPEPEVIDDPLGLDAILFAETGGTHDPDAGAHAAVMSCAESLANAAAQTRVRLAGVAVAVAEASLDWSAGAPIELLDDRLASTDDEVIETLQTLVEIAQATQTRQFPLKALNNGLKRCARSLKRTRSRTLKDLVRILGGVLPRGTLQIPAPEPLPEDVQGALDIGEPRRALAWADGVDRPQDRRIALWLVRLWDAVDPAMAAEALEHLVAEWMERDRHFAMALSVCLGAANLALERTGEALAVSRTLRDHGWSNRNGAVYAEGALLAMEAHLLAGDVLRCDDVRTQSGAALWRMSARGSLSLLARWTPPDP